MIWIFRSIEVGELGDCVVKRFIEERILVGHEIHFRKSGEFFGSEVV